MIIITLKSSKYNSDIYHLGQGLNHVQMISRVLENVLQLIGIKKARQGFFKISHLVWPKSSLKVQTFCGNYENQRF